MLLLLLFFFLPLIPLLLESGEAGLFSESNFTSLFYLSHRSHLYLQLDREAEDISKRLIIGLEIIISQSLFDGNRELGPVMMWR